MFSVPENKASVQLLNLSGRCDITSFRAVLYQVPPIPIPRVHRGCALCTRLPAGEQHSLALRGRGFPRPRGTCSPHCHPTCPSHLGPRPQLSSKPNWYSLDGSIWFFGSAAGVILVVGEFLQHLSHGSDIERVPGILTSQFLGMKNVEELKSVCTCKASLKFLGIKRNPSHLRKHSSELHFTCVHERIFLLLHFSTHTSSRFTLERIQSGGTLEECFLKTWAKEPKVTLKFFLHICV